MAVTAATTLAFSGSASAYLPCPIGADRCGDQSVAYACPNGEIVMGNQACPYAPPANYKTAPLKGTVAAGANHQTVFCPAGSYVSRLLYYADANLTLGGVQLYCKSSPTGAESPVATILGHASTNGAPCCPTSTTALECPSGYAANGIFGASVDVIYRLGLRCTLLQPNNIQQYGPTASTVNSGVTGNPFTPNPLTVPAKGPFECPFRMIMVGLTAEWGPYSGLTAGRYNITALWPDCHHDIAYGDGYYETPPPSIGAAAPRTPARKSYRGPSARGTVKLRLAASHATTGAWYYAIEKVALPAGCGHVPGGFVANRRKRSQHARFKGTRAGFHVKGYAFGALAKPKVHATVTVKKGACSGAVIPFTASPLS